MEITLDEMVKLLANNDPIEVYQELLKNSDEFREFIKRNKDKSTEDMLGFLTM